MFTGIIEEIGRLKSIQKGSKSARLTINARKVLEDTKVGDSIATNGVCLTITEKSNTYFSVDVMHETLLRSNLGALSVGDALNLERAMLANHRFDGHMVSGHIDGTGTITSMKADDIAIWIDIKADESLLKYVIEKGSIAIDGISLTVANITASHVKVSIIPHTKDQTILTKKKKNDQVNIEVDMIAKYVEKLMHHQPSSNQKQPIDKAFLQKYGY